MFDALKQKMIKNSLKYIAEIIFDNNYIDLSSFDDPFALQIDWTPIGKKGPEFRTHNLVQANQYRMEFKVDMLQILRHYAVDILILFIIILLLIPVNIIFSIFPIIAMCSIIRKVYIFFIPVVFDKQNDAFWRGWWKNNDSLTLKNSFHFMKLNDVYALQVVVEHVKEIIISPTSSSQRIYCSYELNFILKDSSRINMIVHGDKEKLKEDAAVLARFLNKPLWDVTSGNAWSNNDKVHDFMKKNARKDKRRIL